MPEYNLIREPWIPCEEKGTIRETSLFDALVNAHHISSLIDPCPPVTASLHRLLLAVLHLVFGPADQGQWEDLWDNGSFDSGNLRSYFDEWQGAFDLFSTSTPFYQNAALSGPELERLTKPIAWIMHERASGNNPTLFDHSSAESPVTLNPAEAARRLITFQSYALPGIITRENGKTVSGKAALLVDRAMFLAVGSNLFETLMLNMVKYDPSSELPFAAAGNDAPAWEQQNSSAPGARLPNGYLDWLTWQPRRLLLQYEETPEGITVDGIRVHLGASLPEEVGTEGFEAMVAFIGKKDQPKKPVRFTEGKGLWRDFYSTVESFREARSDEMRASPRTLQWLGSLAADGVIEAGVMLLAAMGLSKDPANAAKVWLWRQDSLSLPLSYLTDSELAAMLRKALGTVESIGRELSTALYHLVKEIDPDGQVPSFRNPYFWTQAEFLFKRFVADLVVLEPQGELDSFVRQTRDAALKDFDQTAATMGNQAHVLKACVLQRASLVRGINKVIGG